MLENENRQLIEEMKRQSQEDDEHFFKTPISTKHGGYLSIEPLFPTTDSDGVVGPILELGSEYSAESPLFCKDLNDHLGVHPTHMRMEKLSSSTTSENHPANTKTHHNDVLCMDSCLGADDDADIFQSLADIDSGRCQLMV